MKTNSPFLQISISKLIVRAIGGATLLAGAIALSSCGHVTDDAQQATSYIDQPSGYVVENNGK